jgi:hypothetical protein
VVTLSGSVLAQGKFSDDPTAVFPRRELPRIGGCATMADSAGTSEAGKSLLMRRLLGPPLPLLLVALISAACSGSSSTSSPTTGSVGVGPYQQIVRRHLFPAPQ